MSEAPEEAWSQRATPTTTGTRTTSRTATPTRAATRSPRRGRSPWCARRELAFEVVRPEDFEAAQRVADRLRAGASVLIDLEGCDRALAGRLTDFASGLVYALGGSLQHVGGDGASAHAEPHGGLRRRAERRPRPRLLQPDLTTPMCSPHHARSALPQHPAVCGRAGRMLPSHAQARRRARDTESPGAKEAIRLTPIRKATFAVLIALSLLLVFSAVAVAGPDRGQEGQAGGRAGAAEHGLREVGHGRGALQRGRVAARGRAGPHRPQRAPARGGRGQARARQRPPDDPRRARSTRPTAPASSTSSSPRAPSTTCSRSST